jgi:CRISPR/Cas system-associated exonuclease Cas4 (RecB family)
LVEFEDRLEIYDFKRSDTSVGSKTDLQNFEKLQLWVYGLVMGSLKPVKKIGYINVSDIKKNLILETGNEFELFGEKILKLLMDFKAEKKFLPNPRKDNICNYCNVRKICPKGEL